MRVRNHLRSNVVGYVAIFLFAIAGTAYGTHPGGDDTIDGGDIINGQVSSADISNQSGVLSADVRDDTQVGGGLAAVDLASNSVGTAEISNSNGVRSADVRDDTLTGGGLAAVDLAPNSVGSSEIETDGVQATEIANDSIDSGEIVDFSLSNQDVGVLFAQVNADGTLVNSSGGGVSTTKISTGSYEVDFARNVASCAFTATQGEAGVGGAGGAIMGVTDRAGNAEAVFATSRTNTGALADRAFQLVVVC